jgi:hypothetical protein
VLSARQFPTNLWDRPLVIGLPRVHGDRLEQPGQLEREEGAPAHLDVHLGTLQEAQRSVASAVRAQGHQLLKLLQVESELGSSERARDRP